MQKIAIVLPVWRQSALADEAIASVLAQTCNQWHLFIVNDGCPDRDTSVALEAWRQFSPNQISVLTQRNKGLPAARNTAIDAALNMGGFVGYFMLDADNLLEADAVATWLKLISSDTKVGWFYSHFDMFGSGTPQSHGGKWSLSRMAIANMCDAGSLVRHSVFERGLRYDETFTTGYEDWDFWLGAARMGFVGQAVSNGFFRYRKRGSSMLSEAHSRNPALMHKLHEKHKWLFASGLLAETYSTEWPRFAFVTEGAEKAHTGAYPFKTTIARNEVIEQWIESHVDPFVTRLPQKWVFGDPVALEYLHSTKRLPSVLLQMEDALSGAKVATLNFKEQDEFDVCVGMRSVDRQGEALSNVALMMVPVAHINESATTPDMVAALTKFVTKVEIAPIVFAGPDVPAINTASAVSDAVALVGVFHEAYDRVKSELAIRPWREPAHIVAPHELSPQISALNLGGLNLPDLPHQGLKIGFVVPIFKFGGVEKCVVALAHALREIGAIPELFIYGSDASAAEEWMTAPFHVVHQVSRRELRDWSASRYMGTADGRKPDKWIMGQLLGPLTGLDVLVNAGCGPLNHALGALRQFNVKTVLWEHLIEDSGFGRANGTPYLALSHEASCALVLTCSNALSHWLMGQGLASDKLLPLPNGPGFPDKRTLRTPRDGHSPLRVGFMGRLDRQKGVDRFVEVASVLNSPAFVFSLVGAAVVEADNIAIPDFIECHPLARTPEELSEAYARLDVLLMPSRAEGLPLAVLEAQRAGVVPLISDVGAVGEAVMDGENGVLLSPDSVVGEAIAALNRLSQDRALLHRLATAPVPDDRWAENAKKLLDALGLAPLA